jgi:tetratricopeptide (TPR) repeat protein
MAGKLFGAILFATLSIALFTTRLHAGENSLKNELAELNLLTGTEPMRGALKTLVDDKKHAKEMLAYALPAAKDKKLSYNAALVLGLVAAELKEMKTAETFLRVCMDKAAKLQSPAKLQQSYGLMIELYYDNKQYADSARVCRELLELNTDDGTDRIVRRTMVDRNGEVDLAEPQEGFKLTEDLRLGVRELYIKATAKQGKYDQAIKMVDNLITASDDWFDRKLKGWVLKEAGKLEDAAKIYEDVIKQVAKDERLNNKQKDKFASDVRYEVSNVYVDLKKIDRASEHLEYLIRKNPDNPAFYNDLGFIWADHNMKLEAAEKLIRKAIDLDRELRKKDKDYDPKTDHDSGAYLDSLGWVLFKLKKNEEAKDWLLKAIEDKSAQHIEIFDHLGDVYLALGERDQAVKAWQRGLEHMTDSRRDLERKASVEKKLEKAKSSK